VDTRVSGSVNFKEKYAPAANGHREQDRQNSLTGFNFVCPRQPDTVNDHDPDGGD
jgi:hypothetical protein